MDIAKLRPFIITVFLLVIYFVPYLIGRKNKHNQAILALNFLLGWTILGWIGALIWALVGKENDPKIKKAKEFKCPHCGKETAVENLESST